MTSNTTSQSDQLLSAAHVWHVNPDEVSAPDLESRCLHWLPREEHTHLEQLHLPRVRHEYLVTRILCRSMLSHYAGIPPQEWRFGVIGKKKPVIASPRRYRAIRFNLTHTNGLIACAATRAGRIGIDAEQTTRQIDVDSLSAFVLSKDEQDRLRQFAPPQRAGEFLKYWVVKEAWLKGRGTGLFCPMHEITVTFGGDEQPFPIGEWDISLKTMPAGHVAAVALRCRNQRNLPVLWREVGL